MKTEIQKQNEINLAKEKALKAEAFCVEIKLPSQPNVLRLTYSNQKNGVLQNVSELNWKSETISSSTVRGKKIEGDLPKMISDLIPLFRCKPTNWIDYNKELYVDSYYLNH
jgi:hypothetical protein